MNKETKFVNATPRPWSLYTKLARPNEPYQIQDADGVTVGAIFYNSNFMEPEGADDNAALIVEAVNSYDALREALTQAAETAERASLVQDRSVGIIKQTCALIASDLRATLALVDGKQQTEGG